MWSRSTLFAWVALASWIFVAHPASAEAATPSRVAAATCEVSVTRSPLTPAQASLVFGQWGEPPVEAPNGDLYMAPTPGTGGIEELDGHGRVVWQYPLFGPVVGWGATRTVLAALSQSLGATTLVTVNLRTHATATIRLPNLGTYELAASPSNIAVIGTNGASDPSGAPGIALVLDAEGALVRRWDLPTKAVQGVVWAAAYGTHAFLAEQEIDGGASAAEVPDVVYAIDGRAIRTYRLRLPQAEIGFQPVGSGQVLFYGYNPATMNPITSVVLARTARITWQTRGPVGDDLGPPSIVSYGRIAYVSGSRQPGFVMPAWRLNLATGRHMGALHLPKDGVYPRLAGSWGLIALVRRAGAPSIGVFSPDGRLRFTVRANHPQARSEQGTSGFVLAAGNGIGATARFLSSALPTGMALALPGRCGAGQQGR